MPDYSIIVDAQSICLSYKERRIFDDISFTVPKGALTAIMGTSGCGKTTTLRMITGQLLPQSGSCRVFGCDVSKATRAEMYQLRQRMSILFQTGALFSDLTVLENVLFPLHERDKKHTQAHTDVALNALQSVGLKAACDLMPDTLSGGMMRRVAFARAIVTQPGLLLLDEPFTGQDPISKGVLKKIIQDLKSHCTCVLVSHDVPEVLELADYLIIMHGGHIIASGKKETIVAHQSAMVRQFLAGEPDGPVCFHMPDTHNLSSIHAY